MFLAFISSIHAADAPFDYHNKQYSLVPKIGGGKVVDMVGGALRLVDGNSGRGGDISIEPAKDGYSILKINGNGICNNDDELTICPKMSPPTMFNIKQKENENEGVQGFRMKLATDNIFQKWLEKCVYVNGNSLGITRCTSSDNLSQMWEFVPKPSNNNNNPNRPQTPPGSNANGGGMYPQLPPMGGNSGSSYRPPCNQGGNGNYYKQSAYPSGAPCLPSMGPSGFNSYLSPCAGNGYNTYSQMAAC